MKEVYDDLYGEEMDEMYTNVMWGEIGEEFKEILVTATTKAMTSRDMTIPSMADIVKRLKNFYTSRRTVKLNKGDPDKNRARKLAVKANNLTYVSYIHFIEFV